jgi:hypothetical protein
MAAKFFTGLPLDGPDPECVQGHGERALAAVAGAGPPRPSGDHSHRSRRSGISGPVPVSIGRRPPAGRGVVPVGAPDRACDESPLAGFSTRT